MASPSTPATLEKPLSISVTATEGPEPESTGGSLHVSELPTLPGGDARFVAILASSYSSPPVKAHEAMAIQQLLAVAGSGESQPLSELLRNGFRDANRAIHAQIEQTATMDCAGVAVLALLTQGKYATLGLVGADRAYLLRANRLTQLTRDQRVHRARSRRKQDIAAQAATSHVEQDVHLLGEVSQLHARFPAIFEITLLPRDRLALVSQGVVELLAEDRILAALGSSAGDPAKALTSLPALSRSAPVLAAVLEVAPSRETSVYIPPAAVRQRPIWPMVVAALVILLIAAVAVFLAL